MKALVLTCDRYVGITDHMIHTYRELWPTHPFVFRVPYNEVRPTFLERKYPGRVELVESAVDIPATMWRLLEGVPDDEWVYWCLDDKYLVAIDEGVTMTVHRWVTEIEDPSICGVLFSRWGATRYDTYLNLESTIAIEGGPLMIERVPFTEFFSPQFLRASVLRAFTKLLPDREFVAGEMDDFLHGRVRTILPAGEKMFVTDKNLVVFGESTTRGKLTRNCVASFRRWGLPLPETFERSNRRLVLGALPVRMLGREISIPDRLVYYRDAVLYRRERYEDQLARLFRKLGGKR